MNRIRVWFVRLTVIGSLCAVMSWLLFWTKTKVAQIQIPSGNGRIHISQDSAREKIVVVRDPNPVMQVNTPAIPRDPVNDTNDTPREQDVRGTWQTDCWGLIEVVEMGQLTGRFKLKSAATSPKLRHLMVERSDANPREFSGTWFASTVEQGRLSFQVTAEGSRIRGSWFNDVDATQTQVHIGHDLNWRRVRTDGLPHLVPWNSEYDENLKSHIFLAKGERRTVPINGTISMLAVDNSLIVEMDNQVPSDLVILGKEVGVASFALFFDPSTAPDVHCVTITESAKRQPPTLTPVGDISETRLFRERTSKKKAELEVTPRAPTLAQNQPVNKPPERPANDQAGDSRVPATAELPPQFQQSETAPAAESNKTAATDQPTAGTNPEANPPEQKGPNFMQGGSLLISETKDGLAGYSFQTGTWDRLTLGPDSNVSLLKRLIMATDIAALSTNEFIAAFDSTTGRWAAHSFKDKLEKPARVTVGFGACVAYTNKVIYGYVIGNNHWSELEVPVDGKVTPIVGNGWAQAQIGDKIYLLSRNSRNWASPDTPIATSETAQPDGSQAKSALLFPSSTPVALSGQLSVTEQRTLTSVKQHENRAAKIAQEIRSFSEVERKQPSDAVRLLTQELQNELARAFEAKLQWEDGQIQSLRSRLSRVELQMVERRKSRQKIIDRHAAELLDGESTNWTPADLDSRSSSAVPVLKSVSNPNAISTTANETSAAPPQGASADPKIVQSLRKAVEMKVAGLRNGEVTPSEALQACKLLTEAEPSEDVLAIWQTLAPFYSLTPDKGGFVKLADQTIFEVEYAMARERVAQFKRQNHRETRQDSVSKPKEFSNQDINAFLEQYRQRLAPFTERLRHCRERVQTLESTYYQDRSNAAELQQALEQLAEVRRSIQAEQREVAEEMNSISDALQRERESAFQMRTSMNAMLKKKQFQMTEGHETEAELRTAVASAERAELAFRSASERQGSFMSAIQNMTPPGADNLIRPTTQLKPPSRSDPDNVDEFVVPYWFEASLGLKVDFVRFDGLNLPFKAALRVREPVRSYKKGDLIVVIKNKQTFDSLTDVKRQLMSEDPVSDSYVGVVEGGLTGQLVDAVDQFNHDDLLYLKSNPENSVWRFEVRTIEKSGAAPAAAYVNGICISPDGIVAVPIPSGMIGNRLTAFDPEKSAAQVIYRDDSLPVALVKIESDERKLFDWTLCRRIPVALQQRLVIDFRTSNDRQLLAANCKAIEPQKPDVNASSTRFQIVGEGGKLLVDLPTGSPVRTLTQELQGMVIPQDPNEEWNCLEAHVINQLLKAFRATETGAAR